MPSIDHETCRLSIPCLEFFSSLLGTIMGVALAPAVFSGSAAFGTAQNAAVAGDSSQTSERRWQVTGDLAADLAIVAILAWAGATAGGTTRTPLAGSSTAGEVRLVHMTGASAEIAESGVLLGRNGIYATSEATAGRTGWSLTLRTGRDLCCADSSGRSGCFQSTTPDRPLHRLAASLRYPVHRSRLD